VKDYQLASHNLEQFFSEIQSEIAEHGFLLVSTQDPKTGKWGMARLWRSWMGSTATFMAANGVTMPLMFDKEGKPYGKRDFNPDDAHELFTQQWLGVDSDGTRLSWSKSGRDGMRPATQGERFNALRKHESWATERGIRLFNPRDSEYRELQEQQEAA
jgi:hypothetical protein